MSVRLHVQIKSSYSTWRPSSMRKAMCAEAKRRGIFGPKLTLAHIIEWWLHNIGYYITKPFLSIPALERINKRCKDVDIFVEELI